MKDRKAPIKGFIKGELGTFTFQLNPGEWRRSRSIRLVSMGNPGVKCPDYQFDGAEPRNIDIEIYLDSRMATPVDPDNAIKTLEAMQIGRGKTPPKYCTFGWGGFSIDVYIVSMEVTSMEFNTQLQTMKATVRLTLQEAYDQSNSAGGTAPTTSNKGTITVSGSAKALFI